MKRVAGKRLPVQRIYEQWFGYRLWAGGCWLLVYSITIHYSLISANLSPANRYPFSRNKKATRFTTNGLLLKIFSVLFFV